ncbi:MAG: hypothetical protein KC476_02450 [Cyanobacteria bacterium HKST-UBA06]|nr:hypothetical protein [Cyanobacteria bacterium HKST-UBA06]
MLSPICPAHVTLNRYRPRFSQTYVYPSRTIGTDLNQMHQVTGDAAFLDANEIITGNLENPAVPKGLLPEGYPAGPYDVLVTTTGHDSVADYQRPREAWCGASVDDRLSDGDDAAMVDFLAEQQQLGAVTVIAADRLPERNAVSEKPSGETVSREVTLDTLLGQMAQQLGQKQVEDIVAAAVGQALAATPEGDRAFPNPDAEKHFTARLIQGLLYRLHIAMGLKGPEGSETGSPRNKEQSL